MAIAYRSGYKYQLVEETTFQTALRPREMIELGRIRLHPDGLLAIDKWYAWDGPSGPTFDTANFMRGSLAHDALYELLRHGKLHASSKKAADDELARLCREDGMSRIRVKWVRWAVGRFGKSGTRASGRKRVYYAP